MSTNTNFLVSQEEYLEAGIHIGTKMRTPDMDPFIYKSRADKLYVLDLKKVDERLRLAANLMAKYKPEDILIVASRIYAVNPATKFAEIIGCKVVKGRFVPGRFTNPARNDFCEPKLVFVCNPKSEKQAVHEAAVIGIPVIALCDTDNYTKFVDLIVPSNNKGKKALGLIFYILCREFLLLKGLISNHSEFKTSQAEFEGEGETEEENKEESKEG